MTEEEKIKALIDNNKLEEAFGIIINLYQKKVYYHIKYRVLNHEDSDDICQNVFIKIWKNIIKFNWKASIKTWIYTITINETNTFLKRKNRLKFFSIYEDEIKSYSEEYFDGNDIEKKLWLEINKLPTKQKEIFILRYKDEIKFKEIAKILGVAEGTVKSSFNIAKNKLINKINTFKLY